MLLVNHILRSVVCISDVLNSLLILYREILPNPVPITLYHWNILFVCSCHILSGVSLFSFVIDCRDDKLDQKYRYLLATTTPIHIGWTTGLWKSLNFRLSMNLILLGTNENGDSPKKFTSIPTSILYIYLAKVIGIKRKIVH